MPYLGRAEEEFDGLMQVSFSDFSLFEECRARANLQSRFMSELRLYSLSVLMLNAENVVFKNYKSGSLSETAFLELLNCAWHHSLYFTTVCTP